MLHILTVHFRAGRWVEIQRSFLQRHITQPYRSWASLEGVPERFAEAFDVVVESRGRHEWKLNHMAARVCETAPDDDVMIFLDGDAFPIADPMPTIRAALASTDLLAVRRSENLGDPQPHPCFAAVSVGTWKRLGGDWAGGYPWRNELGETVSDVGGNLLYLLGSKGATWTPLLRTNTVNKHPIWFAVYGDIVYHHGAGFRRAFSRSDVNPMQVTAEKGPIRSLQRWRARRWKERRIVEMTRTSEEIIRRIRRDPDFFREVCGVTLEAPSSGVEPIDR